MKLIILTFIGFLATAILTVSEAFAEGHLPQSAEVNIILSYLPYNNEHVKADFSHCPQKVIIDVWRENGRGGKKLVSQTRCKASLNEVPIDVYYEFSIQTDPPTHRNSPGYKEFFAYIQIFRSDHSDRRANNMSTVIFDYSVDHAMMNLKAFEYRPNDLNRFDVYNAAIAMKEIP